MTKDTGGPAFPHVMRRISEDISEQITGGGMTLRDWFAGQAFAGFSVENSEISIGPNETPDEAHRRFWRVLAESAYVAADAMIAERSKP